jgi:ribosomal protein S6--L-glutamate ligase
MKIAFWTPQIDIEKAFRDRGHKTVALDWHKADWHEDFTRAQADAYVWYPHALHKQWFRLPDRAAFVEFFLKKRVFPDFKTSYLFQNKMHQEYAFSLLKIPRPKTFILTTEEEIENYLLSPLDFPAVVKNMWNYGGFGVSLLKNKKALEEYIAKKRMPRKRENAIQKNYIYLQEYLDLEEEFRVMTVGQKIILAYRKKSDQFLGHVWRGAKVDFSVSRDVKDFVIKYNKALKLDCSGWDLAREKSGKLKLIEINPIAGTKVLEGQGIPLADHIAGHILKEL